MTAAVAMIPVASSAAATTSASDSFERTVSGGWGSATTGGAWSGCGATCNTQYSVSGGAGRVSVAPGTGSENSLAAVSTADSEASVAVAVDRAATGGGTYLALVARGTNGTGYRGKLRIRPDGGVEVSIVRTVSHADTSLASGSMPAGTYVAGQKLRMRMRAVGSSPTSLALKVWKADSAEPTSWNLTATDSAAALQAPGPVGLWTYVSGSATNGPAVVSFDDFVSAPSASAPAPQPSATPTPTPTPTATTAAGAPGASLPINYALSTLGGTLRYVAPGGSDTTGTGSITSPFKTLVKAESVAAAGDSIVLRGGTYPITSNTVYVDRPGLTIIAYPGETPVFDGSIPAPTAVGSEGTLRYFAYQPMRGGLGEGQVLAHLPKATFSGSSPTGLAAQRGWRCVSGSSYSTPAPTATDPDGCSSAAHVITAYYPDQVWVNGTALQQVSDKSRVTTGTFWLARTAATDSAPAVTNLYLSATDAADMSKVRVSASQGSFFQVAADRVRLEGVQIQRHSPGGSHYAVVLTQGVDDFVMRNVRFDSNAGAAFKLPGGGAANGSQLVRRTVIDRVSVTRSGFMGALQVNADDTTITNTLFQNINMQREFQHTPVSGGIKSSTSHRLIVRDSRFENIWGHGLWLDQSNYVVTVAGTSFLNNSHSSVFFEISHGLTLVNNYIKGPATAAGDEGHSTVRLAGASGVRLVNNTILAGPVGIGVYTDLRSKKYDSNGDGTLDRLCSEHTVRYGAGGDSWAACNSPYVSDFDTAHPGAYSPTGAANQTPGMTWLPSITMMVNNVIANQTGKMAEGWTPCGGYTPVCVFGYVTSPAIDVAMNSIFAKGAIVNGNVYQTSGTQIVSVNTRTQTAATGAFKAADLTALKGANAFGSSYYGLSVEGNGRSGGGWVSADGTSTSQLAAIQGQAATVPTEATVNLYVSAGSRSYGYVG